MNKLSADERAKVLQLLCEGMSIRAVSRVTGVNKNTVIKLLNDAGRALGVYQDEAFRNLSCKRVQVDEIWSFTYCKQKNVATAKAAPLESGDAWTWTADLRRHEAGLFAARGRPRRLPRQRLH